MKRSVPSIVPLLLTIALSACEDDAVGPGDDAREIVAEPSFAEDVNEILQRRGCSSTGCHGSGGGGLTLTASSTANYAQLVGVAAVAESFLRVDPGDAENSYVVIKTEGRQSSGQRMPLGGPPLDDIDQTNLRNWIDNGAPNN